MSINGSTASRSLNRPKLSTQLQDLLGATKKVLNYEKDIAELDQNLDTKRDLEGKLSSKTAEVTEKNRIIASKDQEIASLQLNKSKEIASLLSAKDKEITKLQLKNDGFLEEFQKRYKAWDIRTTKQKQLEGELVQLKLQLGEATEIADSTKSELTSLQEELLECQDTLDDTEEKFNGVKKELDSKDRELIGAISKLGYLQEEKNALGLEVINHEDLTAKFSAFAEHCHNLARKFFFTQLPENLAQNDLQVKLRSSGFIKIALRSIPLSGSPQSKYLRMAAAEKVIACKLDSDVFQQYYLPDSSSARKAMDEVLNLLSQSNSYEEAIFRLRLLSAYQDKQEEHIRTITASALSEIIKTLSPLLSPSSLASFHSELKMLLQEAFKLWTPVQRSVETIAVENEPDQEWGKYEDYDAEVGLNADEVEHIASNPMDALFPRVSIGDDVICLGYALWSGQSTVIAAGIEYKKSGSPQQTHKRTNSSRGGTASGSSDRRRLSSSGSVGGRPGDSPTSPRTQSFMDHMNRRNKPSP